MRRLFPALLLTTLLCTCDRAQPTAVAGEEGPPEGAHETDRPVNATREFKIADAPNPAARGFNLAGSDEKAIAIADSIVKHHGGREAWDATRYLSWNFFGARTLWWDRHAYRARIEVPEKNTVYLLDYSTEEPTGRAQVEGEEIIDPVGLSEAVGRANSMLINDSYWLVQQFKLKDSGTTLTAVDDVPADPLAGRPSYVIDLTFEGVGESPQNRYRLYVDRGTYRINTWQFFRNADDSEPAMQTPWQGVQPYNGLLLSGDRGGRYQLSEISVPRSLPESLFTDF